MVLFEVFVPKGSLGADARRQIGERLIAEVIHPGDAPPAAHEMARAMRTLSWALVHEVDTWVVDDGAAGAGDPPRYFVRVSVTGGPLSDSKRDHVVEAATRALAEVDGDHDRLYAEPEAWIQMVEVPDGGWGTRGQVTGFADVIAMIRARSAALAG